MKNLTRVLYPLGVALLTLPLTASICNVAQECETDADCVAPETCNTILGVCEGAEGEGEGEGEGDVACDGGAIDDGACLEDRPADLADPYVCDGTICVEPDSLLGNCGGGNGNTYDGGPVILDVTEISTGNDGDPCSVAAEGGYNAYLATVYSETAFDDGLNANNLHYINASGTASGTYSEVGLLPEATAIAGADGYYTLDFYLCGNGGDGAVHLANNDGGSGNAFCMDQAQ